MSPAQEQFARMKRYLLRMEKKGATDEDTDDLYSFFLHAWHLIDWASHDPALGTDPELARKKLLADITKAISGCKDIANRTKHLELMLRYCVKTIAKQSLAEALDATEGERISDLRIRIKQLFKERRPTALEKISLMRY